RLLRNLGSIQRIAQAGVAELTPFVGAKTAAEIVEHFTRQRALAESGGAASSAATAPEQADLPDESVPRARPGGDDPTVMTDETIGDEHIETRLVDPEGDAEDLQPIRSVDHAGELRKPRRPTRKRGERSTNPHGVKRERLTDADTEAPDKS
ncbi:MAG TPA: hypothetical protein VF240_02310, partial [Pyrinomonadaceae bacterium]